MSRLKNVKRRWGDVFSQTHWAQVEHLLADHYRAEGYRVEHCGTGAGGSRFDGGIDLRLFRGDEYIVVQCKHWNAKQVPHNAVHELIGVRITERATGAILVTSGEYTYAALKAAAKEPTLELVDGEGLRRMLGPLMPVDSAPALADGHLWQPVTEMALDVASNAMRLSAPKRQRRGLAKSVGGLVLIKVVAPLLLFLAFVWFVRGAINDLGTNSVARRPAPAAVQVVPARPPPVADVVRLAPAPVDAVEMQRRNDEAMKVLEASTPELEHMPGSVPASVEH